MKKSTFNYMDYVTKLYNPLEYDNNCERDKQFSLSRSVTFQTTTDCCCNCSYCYQINKGHEKMTKEIGKQAVDLLFNLWYDSNNNFFDSKTSRGLVFDFVGGEPLMNIDTMDYICSYFLDRCIKEHHPWAYTWRINMISNGKFYFTNEFQQFLKKFNNFCYFNVSIDGPKELHDSCRTYFDGSGNFDDAWKAIHHYRQYYNNNPSTKVTIAPENLLQINQIIKFFIQDDVTDILANVVYEAEWTVEQGRTFYKQLKEMADYLLSLPDDNYYVSLFDPMYHEPLLEEDTQNWCGGDGRMLAFTPNGDIYPCIRFTPTSLGTEQKPLKIGNVNTGVYQTAEEKEIKNQLLAITRKTQSTDECFNCPIASGCSWCTAWNYQETGSVNKRSTRICHMHKAKALANVYFWNKFYRQTNQMERKKLRLSKEECLNYISEEEYNLLLKLSEEDY